MKVSSNGSALLSDRELIEDELAWLLSEKTMPGGGPVHDAMRYAVMGSGQRLRPVIALRVGRLMRADEGWVLRAAAAVELLHCASLIIDDLPCMDDERTRRGRATVHVEFGEATAILAAFGLVALAARCAVEGMEPPLLARGLQFQRDLLWTLDCGGLLAGQALDLSLAGASRDTHRDCLTHLKTVPLFELAVKAGLAFAPVSPAAEAALLHFGREFGLAYQMTDDLLDGEESSPSRLAEQLDRVSGCLHIPGPEAQALEELIGYLHAKAARTHNSHR